MGYPTKMIDAKPLRDLQRLHNLSARDLSNRLDISLSAIHQYLREGKMPAVLRMACKGLDCDLRGHSPLAAERPLTLVVRTPASDSETTLKLLNAVGAKYRLIDEFLEEPRRMT